MIRIERTQDMDWVRSVVGHPALWRHLSGRIDGADQWAPAHDDHCYWVIPTDDTAGRLGVILFYPHTQICWEVHVAFLPGAWGPRASRAARAAREWLFASTACEKLITWVPVTNRPALAFALRSGMAIEGLCRSSFRHEGRLVDQHLLGLSKGGSTCH